MRYYKNDVMKQRVSKLEAQHRRLYKFISGYFCKWNTSPLIDHMVLEMCASSEEEIYQLLADLTCAGCLAKAKGELKIQPMLSPEEAAMWCGDDAESVNEKMCLIKRAVSVAHFTKNGSMLKFSEFMEPYRKSNLYLLIREQAEPYFYKCISAVQNESAITEPVAGMAMAGT